jgi:tetratricopeptide (TPR) repeat protein
MKYRAFISYSHDDRKWARWLHRKLEAYQPPRRLGGDPGERVGHSLRPIFRDRDELSTASDLSEAVQRALAESEWLIVICSPSAARSRWVNEEVQAFQALGRASRILCFLVEGEPGTSDLGNCFPPALTAPAEPGGPPLEPMAADARPQGDGRKNAMLKVAAGLLGVGFDALRQRDTRRRQRRLVGLAAGSLGIASITIVLAIYAWIARGEAQERRAQAEDLIEFMLGDLREQLNEIGRLDVFESVGGKALEYFTQQDPDQESEHSLAQRARNLRQIGEVRMEQGNLEAAMEAFNQSLRYAEQLAWRAPDDPDASLSMANSLFYVGYVHWQRGELSEARGIFESIIPVVDEVSARDPDNPDWLVERAYANTNLGRLLELEGDYEKALAAYQSVMDVNQRLLTLDPDNPEWELELGFAHNNLGKLLVGLGRLDAAEQHYRADLDIKARFHARDRNHNVNRSYLGISQYYLGQLLVERGKYVEAEPLLTSAHGHFRFLNDVDPDRKRWRVRRANIERELGELMALSGREPDGLQWLARSVEELETLMESDPDNNGWRRDLVSSLLAAADFGARKGSPTGATDPLAAAENSLGLLLELEPSSLETHALAAYADVCAAIRASDRANAESHWNAALEKLDRQFSGSRDPHILELRAAALAALGQAAAAAGIGGQLVATGYRGLMLAPGLGPTMAPRLSDPAQQPGADE